MAGAEGSRAQGQRMRKLEQAFQRTVKYALRGAPHDEFYAYFPEGPLSDAVLDSAYDGYRQALVQGRTNIEVDFQNVCEETSIIDKLYTLDMMCAQQGIVDGATEPVKSGAAPTKAARAAAFKARQEEAKRLTEILEEVKRLEEEAKQSLEEKKKAAQELIASSTPLDSSNLAEVHATATAWAQRGTAVA